MTKLDRNAMSQLEIAVWATAFVEAADRGRRGLSPRATVLEDTDIVVVELRAHLREEREAEIKAKVTEWHKPKISRGLLRCACGAAPPETEQNPDDWMALHIARIITEASS